MRLIRDEIVARVERLLVGIRDDRHAGGGTGSDVPRRQA